MLNRCCGCISIATGTKIIGILSLIWTSLMTIAMGIFIHELQFFKSPFLSSEHTLRIIQIFMDSSLVYSVIRAVSSALLLTASIRRAARYFLPWLAYTLSDILSGVCISLGFIIVIPGILPIWELFPTIIVLISIIGLQIYSWIVVYTDYRSIVLEKDSHPTDSADAKILDQTAVNTDNYV